MIRHAEIKTIVLEYIFTIYKKTQTRLKCFGFAIVLPLITKVKSKKIFHLYLMGAVLAGILRGVLALQAVYASDTAFDKQYDGYIVAGKPIKKEELYLMARVIEGEAANEPFSGKVAVGAVMVNRMESGQFPKTMKEVVNQPLAFEAVSNGQYLRPLSKDSIKAARLALEGQDPTSGSLYYWNPQTAKSKWVWQRPVTMQIGRHVFAK